MKTLFKMMLLSSLLLASLSAKSQERKGSFELSASTLFPLRESVTSLEEVKFAYNFSEGFGVVANGLMSPKMNNGRVWGTTVGIQALPKVADRLYLMPSLGFGVAGGMYDRVIFLTDFSTILRYELSPNLFTGLEAKSFLTTKDKLFFLGINLGVRF